MRSSFTGGAGGAVLRIAGAGCQLLFGALVFGNSGRVDCGCGRTLRLVLPSGSGGINALPL